MKFCSNLLKKSIIYKLIVCFLFCEQMQPSCSLFIKCRRATRGGEGGGLPCPFLKIKKSVLILEKKALIMHIFGLNLPFNNCSFKSIYMGPLFLVFLKKCLSKCPNFTKPPLPLKFLVARLKYCSEFSQRKIYGEVSLQ